MFRQIFRDLKSFKRELKGLAKNKPLRTEEAKQNYVPNTVSIETYMYALDKKAIIDQAVSDMQGKNSALK
jgi:hypothetical protein